MDIQPWTFSYLRIKRDVNTLMKCMYMKDIRRKAKNVCRESADSARSD